MKNQKPLTDIQGPPGNLQAWIIWGIAALFYLYEYFIRVAPSVMEHELMREFQVRATQLGGALATYYYIYAPMQIFAGVLFDRFGGRRLLVPASLFVAIGCFFVLWPQNQLWVVTTSRFLMGLGSAFGFVGVLYLASIWFPHSHLALLSGLTTALGMLGAILGEAPLAEVIDICGWRMSLVWAGIFGCILAILIYMGIPRTPPWERKRRAQVYEDKEHPHNLLYSFVTVIKNRQTWIIGFIAGALFMPLTVFADLWGVQYIVNITGVSKTKAAGAVSMLYLGWMIGGPIAGILSDKWQKRKTPMLIGCALSTILLLFICLDSQIAIKNMYILLFLLGLTSCVEIISFVATIETNPAFAKGTSVATCNMIVTFIGGLFQYVFGYILDYVENYHGTTELILYSAKSYQTAILILPIMMFLAFIACLWMKESFKNFENN